MNQLIDSMDGHADEKSSGESPDLSYWSGFCESYHAESWPLNELVLASEVCD